MSSSQAPEVLTVSDYWKLVTARLNDMIVTKVRVRGIIRNFKVNGGNAYFDIAEDADSTHLANTRSSTARISAVIWRTVLPQMQYFLNNQGFDPLGNDLEMVFIGSLNIYPPSGRVSFNVTDIDIDELRRSQQIDIERIRAQLRIEGVFDKNRNLTLSEVPLKVALVTAETGTVQHDFRNPLEASGFAFEVMLLHTRVGSLQAADEIADTVLRAGNSGVDLVVLLRGGGAATDLAVFNTLEVCRAVASCTTPVWCAIGHAQDHVLVNEVANRSFDVPQSAGAALADWVRGYLERMQGTLQALSAQASINMRDIRQSIFNLASSLSANSNAWATSHRTDLSLIDMRISHATYDSMSNLRHDLSQLERQLTQTGVNVVSKETRLITQLRWTASTALVNRLNNVRNQLPHKDAALGGALARLSSTHAQVLLLQEKLTTRDPQTVLRLGYAVVSEPSGKRIRSVTSALQLSQIDIHFVDGKASFQPIHEGN